jgi:hypothetical protein
MSLYDFVRRTKKVIIPKKVCASSPAVGPNVEVNKQLQDLEGDEETPLDDVDVAPPIAPTVRRGRCSNARGNFLPSHPQSKTHQLMEISSPIIPIVLGPSIPHPEKGEPARELWSKSMLILFKPWRQPLNLKSHDESWTLAFERSVDGFDDRTRAIMDNFLVLHKCKDVRNNDMNSKGFLSMDGQGNSSERRNAEAQPHTAMELDGDLMDFISAPVEDADEGR